MSGKRNQASRKCCDLSKCHVKNRRKCEGTKNILECKNIKQPKRNVVQYLYVDPLFIEEATCSSRARLRGGGEKGDIGNEEHFYDCASESEWEEYNGDPFQQQLLQTTNIINQIQEPKQFKDLLKEVAYTSYMLYRSFRKAYSKTKRDDNEHKCEYCRQREKLARENYNNVENKDPSEPNLNKVPKVVEKNPDLCPICSQPLADNTTVPSVKSLNQSNPEYKRSKLKNPASATAQPDDSKLTIGSTAPVSTKTSVLPKNYLENEEREPGVNEQGSQTEKSIKPANSSKNTIKEQWSQTDSPEGITTNESASKSCLCSKGRTQDQLKMFYLKPVSVSIPLKLQVEAENMKPHFIETEIILKSSGDPQPLQQSSSRQPQLLTGSMPRHAASSSQNQAAATTGDVVSTPQNHQEIYFQGSPLQAASDIFYSCISSSGIIEPIMQQTPKGEASLNKVFEIVNKRMQTRTEVAPPTAVSKLETKIPQMPSHISQLDAKVHSTRGELLKEVKDTLERSSPEIVLKDINNRKLPDSSTTRSQNIPKQTVPTVQQAEDPKAISSALQMVMRKNQKNALEPLSTQNSWSRFIESVTEPTGLISENIQTDVTAVKPTGHYKRNDLRIEIKEDLQELLEPKPKISDNKYQNDERDEILLDLSNLFHPETAPKLSTKTNKNNALDDIRFILEPPKPAPLTSAASRTSIVINVRYILSPKLKYIKKPARKIYSKEAREKILGNLHEVLTPKRLRPMDSLKTRDSVLHDLRFLLDKGVERAIFAKQAPQPVPSQQNKTTKPQLPTEIGSSVLDELKYFLDSNRAKMSDPASTHQPVPPSLRTNNQQQLPRTENAINDTAKIINPPTDADVIVPRKNDKVDQAKLNPSSQVVDQSPIERLDTTKAEGVSLTSTLSTSNTSTSSDTFFAQLQDSKNYLPRSTLKDTDEKEKEIQNHWKQKLMGQVENVNDMTSRDGAPIHKARTHASESSQEYLNNQSREDIGKNLRSNVIKKSDLPLEPKRKLSRLSETETRAGRSTDALPNSKSRQPKDLSQIMERTEPDNVTSSNRDSRNDLLPRTDSKIKPDKKSSMASYDKPQPEKRPSKGRSNKATNDSIAKPQEKYNDRALYSELLLESENRPSIIRYAKLFDDSHEKQNDFEPARPQSRSKPTKPNEDANIKPQEKFNDHTRYSEQLLEMENRQSMSRYAKPIDDSQVKPQEELHDRTRYSKQLHEPEIRSSISRNSKPIEDSSVSPQNRTRYSEQLLEVQSRQSTSKHVQPSEDPHANPKEKFNDRTRYSEQLLLPESRQSIIRNAKPTDDSYVKPQDGTRYSKLLLEVGSKPSLSGHVQPSEDSHVKPQDRTRYSELLLEVESRPSTSRHVQPSEDSHIKPQEKLNDRSRFSEQLIKPESRQSISRSARSIEDSNVKQQDGTRYSELLLEVGSRPSITRHDQPSKDSHLKPQDRTRYSELLLEVGSRPSTSRHVQPNEDSHIKPQEKFNDRSRFSEELTKPESRQSISRSAKSIEDSYVKPQDGTRYSELLLEIGSRPSVRRHNQPSEDSHIKSQEKLNDRSRFSEQLIKPESRQSIRRSAKSIEDSNVKPQDGTRYSELHLEVGSRPSISRHDQPSKGSHVKPQDRTRYSEQLLEVESRPSTSRHVQPNEDSHIKPQEKFNDRSRFSEELTKPESRQSISRSAKSIEDSYVKPQDGTRYSELLLEIGSRPSVRRHNQPSEDSHIKSQEKLNDRSRFSEQLIKPESRQSISRSAKSIEDSYVKPQDGTRYSELLLEVGSRPSVGRHDQPSEDSNIKSQEKLNDRSRFSKQLIKPESRQSISRSAKSIEDSYVKPQDGTRYSELLLEVGSRPSVGRHDQPSEDSNIKSQEKLNDRSRFSQQLIKPESRQSISRSAKSIEDSNVKPQDGTRYSELLLEVGSRSSITRHDQPSKDSHVKPQDRTRYSELLHEVESRPSTSRHVQPDEDSQIQPQEKLSDGSRFSEQLIKPESRQSISRSAKSIEDSYVKPQDGTRYSELLLEVGSRPSVSRHDQPSEDSHVQPQDRTRYSELILETESRPSASSHHKPVDESLVKAQDITRNSNQPNDTKSGKSISRSSKPIKDSFVMSEEKLHDRTRQSELLFDHQREPSIRKNTQPTEDSYAKPQESPSDRTRYSELLVGAESQKSISRYTKPNTDAKVKPQEKHDDGTRYSEIHIEGGSRPSRSKYDKPIDDAKVKPQEKHDDGSRYSEIYIEGGTRPSASKVVNPDTKAKPQEKNGNGTRYSESRPSTSKYGNPIDDAKVKPQEKNDNGTRYSEIYIDGGSRPSLSKNAKRSDDPKVRPQEKYDDRTRYSEIYIEDGNRPSTSKYGKPIDDAKVKPQARNDDGGRYSEIYIESRPSASKFVKPAAKAKPQEKYDDGTRYSESRSSANKYGKPSDDAKDKPQEKYDDGTRYSEIYIEDGSRASASKHGKPIDDAKVKPQARNDDGSRYSEIYIEGESRPSASKFVKPAAKAKPQEKYGDGTRYSESRSSANKYGKPSDDAKDKPQEKYDDGTRTSEIYIEGGSRPSASKFVKPAAKAKPQEKYDDGTRYSKSRLSSNKYGKPSDDAKVKPQEKHDDGTRYSEIYIEGGSRPSASIYGKPIDDAKDKLQEKYDDGTRYSEIYIEGGIRPSTSKYPKPSDDAKDKPKEKNDVGTRHSEIYIEAETRPSTTRYSISTERYSYISKNNVESESRLHGMPAKTPLESKDDITNEKGKKLEQQLSGQAEKEKEKPGKGVPDDLENFAPERKIHHHGTGTPNDASSPLLSDIAISQPDFKNNLSRISDDKAVTSPQRYSEDYQITRQVSQHRGSINDSLQRPENKIKPKSDNTEQRLSAKVSSESKPITQSESRTSRKSFPKSGDVSNVDLQEKYSDRRPDITRTSDRHTKGQRRPPQSRDSKILDRQSYISLLSDLNIAKSNQHYSRQSASAADDANAFPDVGELKMSKVKSSTTLNENPEKFLPASTEEILLKSTDDRDREIRKSWPQEPTGQAENKKDKSFYMDDLGEFSPKPKVQDYATKSYHDNIDRSHSASASDSDSPLLSDMVKPDLTVKPSYRLPRLLDTAKTKTQKQESESLSHQDLMTAIPGSLSDILPHPENIMKPSRPEDTGETYDLDIKSPKTSYDKQQSVPSTISTDSKIIIKHDSRPVVNRFEKASKDSNGNQPDITQFESKSPTKSESQTFMATPHPTRLPGSTTDSIRDQLYVELPSLSEDNFIKSNIPEDTPIRDKGPGQPDDKSSSSENISIPEDYIPSSNENRSSLPTNYPRRKRKQMIKKYSAPNMLAYNIDRNQHEGKQPEGEDLQSSQDKNEPQLPKESLEQHKSPTIRESPQPNRQLITNKDSKPTAVDVPMEVVKDKQFASTDDKSLIYLYSRQSTNDDNKENQPNKENLQINLRTSISSDLIVRPPVVTNIPEVKANVNEKSGSKEKTLTPHGMNIEQSLQPGKNNNFTSATAMVLRTTKRKESVTKLQLPSGPTSYLPPTASAAAVPLKSIAKDPDIINATAPVQTRDSQLIDTQTILQKPSYESVNQGIFMAAKVIKGNEDQPISTTITPQTQQNVPQVVRMKQSTSSLLLIDNKKGISTNAEIKDPEGDRINISGIKTDTFKVPTLRPDQQGISTATFIAKGTKPAQFKKPAPVTDPSQGSSRSPNAVTDPSAKPDPPDNKGFVTSITIQSKSKQA